MSPHPFIPDDPASIEWDVAVIGTGMGGAVAGHALAKCGWRVLFIEKGHLFDGEGRRSQSGAGAIDARSPAGTEGAGETPDARLNAGWWPVRLQGETSFGKVDFFAPLGCGSGGSTALYAAALERFTPSDFRPRANFPEAKDSALPEAWPITYEDLRPFYVQAEGMFRVAGTPDPLGHGGEENLREPPPPSPRDRHFLDSFGRLGLHPYRIHAGYEFVEGCTECTSQRCNRACKSDSGRICLLPALQQHGAKILPECEVLRLEAGPSEVREIHCRRQGQNLAIRAKFVVLAAGAYMTPVLLLNSRSSAWPDGLANRSGQVGRNLMVHASDFVAVKPMRRLSIAGPLKSLALNDFYLSEGEKLGTFQSSGAAVTPGQIMQYMRDVADRDPTWWNRFASPRPVWWRKLWSPVVRLIALTAYHVFNFKNSAVWATVVEDLPYADNRVVPDPLAPSGMHFEYRYRAELRKRVQSFRRRLAKALSPHRIIVLSGENNLNFGHPCGTCRFGEDPETSVLDKNNRAHGISNLYVVDASFFPSSGGTNPSLTIAANALRVAQAVHAQPGATGPAKASAGAQK